jgi:L-threonylcarbamoyladenylate synthase
MSSTTVIDLHHWSEDFVAIVTKTLAQGAIVAYPTDTIYGLGCDASNLAAVQSLNALKGRSAGKPMSVLYASVERVLADFPHLTAFQQKAVRQLLPGPVTLILPAPSPCSLAKELIANGWIGVRVIALPVMMPLLQAYPRPITTTSVNPAGEVPARSAGEILSYFAGQISLILDYGELCSVLPSTVVRISSDSFSIERSGAVPDEFIQTQLTRL